jgi:hypothetical protein
VDRKFCYKDQEEIRVEKGGSAKITQKALL